MAGETRTVQMVHNAQLREGQRTFYAGNHYEVPAPIAERLIAHGVAEEAKGKAAKKQAEDATAEVSSQPAMPVSIDKTDDGGDS